MWDSLWLGHVATMTAGGGPYGAIRDGALAIKAGRIAWLGAQSALQDQPEKLATDVFHMREHWITPGLVDCHTHLVFAGDRAGEFEMRLNGAAYEDIARAGGGIAATVAATRAASLADLGAASAGRLKRLMAEGVTTVEIKSGYGLELETEKRMLAAARGLAGDVRVRTTFLALHALPQDYKDNRAAYVDLVCEEMLPALADAGLVDAVDAFCEGIGFSAVETEQLFAAAANKGLRIKLHAEQLSDTGGAQLAARYQALSADHLEYVSEQGIAAMAEAGAVAVLLPGAFYFLRETKKPPVEKLRAAGVKLALATDCNPGTSPLLSPLLAMNMGCTLFGLTPEEALAGFTREGARALGLLGDIGTLEVGKAADLAVWRVKHPAELSYWLGASLLRARVFAGRAFNDA
jgi:imidazolonepropionase